MKLKRKNQNCKYTMLKQELIEVTDLAIDEIIEEIKIEEDIEEDILIPYIHDVDTEDIEIKIKKKKPVKKRLTAFDKISLSIVNLEINELEDFVRKNKSKINRSKNKKEILELLKSKLY